jgi:DNA/RNA endonuclease YhcR with UshA esterase domain
LGELARPQQVFTVVIWGSNRDKFSPPPEQLQGKKIEVKGVITVYRDKPQIEATDPLQIKVKE